MTRWIALLLVTMCLVLPATVRAEHEEAVKKGEAVVARSVAFLKKAQQANGSWTRSDREPSAISGLVLRAMTHDKNANADAIKRATEYLLGIQQQDGGIYQGMLANYNTAINLSALAATGDPKTKDAITKAVEYLKANQFSDNVAGVDASSAGGWGYGGLKGRADLSNAAIVMEALKDAGLDEKDPAFQKALDFTTRMQNNSETNKSAWAGDDGGFIYGPGNGGAGESSAGETTTPEGKTHPRSYGSMTYGALKSMIYAGLTKDDPRVKAAWNWIASNWTVTAHPGLPEDRSREGIFYYYHTLARALSVYGEPNVVDAEKKSHDWRVELIDELAKIQKEDGSFAGEEKWMENHPIIATVLATLAAQDALEDLKKAGK